MAILEYRSASPAARYVEERIADQNRFLRKSSALGIEHLIRGELAEVWDECSEPDWDGYDALPVSLDSMENAERFLLALPLGTMPPSIGAMPNGNVSLEWHHSRRRSLTVTVTPEGDLHYAALLGPARGYGTERFVDEVPKTMCDLIARVYAC